MADFTADDGIEEAPTDGQQYTRGNTAWDAAGIVVSANLTLDGAEPTTNFRLVATATRTLTLPLASTVAADYLLNLSNRSDKKNTKWVIATQGGDTINGGPLFSINTGETGLVERTSSTTFQITNAAVDVPSVSIATSAAGTDGLLIFNAGSGIIETISVENFFVAFKPKFANFFQEGNASSTIITTVDVFEDINCSLTGDKLNDFTVSGNTITYIGTRDIDVEILLTTSIDPADTNRDVLRLKAFKNGSTALNGEGKSQNDTNNLNDLKATLSLFSTASLVQNDTIDLKVANGTNGSDMTVEEISGIIKEI